MLELTCVSSMCKPHSQRVCLRQASFSWVGWRCECMFPGWKSLCFLCMQSDCKRMHSSPSFGSRRTTLKEPWWMGIFHIPSLIPCGTSLCTYPCLCVCVSGYVYVCVWWGFESSQTPLRSLNVCARISVIHNANEGIISLDFSSLEYLCPLRVLDVVLLWLG